MRSPLWWGALALLLLNDHALKGAGLLPGVVTGKLSDFAGLIVAPVLVVALVGARSARSRAVAFAVVAAGFAAIKLSPWAAAELVAALAWVGIHWRIWSDPSDLVALASLPIAFVTLGPLPTHAALSQRTPRLPLRARTMDALRARTIAALRARTIAALSARTTPPRSVRIGAWIERAGVLLGLVACMATSQATTPGQWQTSAYVINGSDHPIDLRVRFPSEKVDYGALGDHAARALGTSAYDEGITFHLASRATLPIAHLAAMTAAGLDTSKVDEGDATSGLVLLQADGLPDTIASWHSLYVAAVPTTVDANFDGASIASGGVGLMPAAPGAPTELFAVASGGVLLQHALATAEPSACAGNQGESFQWSALAPVKGTLASITTLPGGCLDLELEVDATADAGGQHLSLCIPSAALPFKVGDSLTITATQEPGPISLRMDTLGGGGPQLIVLSAQPMISDSLLHNHLVPFDCEGDRTDCGAYVVPASLEVTTPGGIVRIPPGGEATIDGFGPSGGSARVLVGRAEQVIATSAECDAGRWLPRTVGDFVIVYGGVP